MSKKAVVLFSGGMDSTTMLVKAIKQHGEENVIALSLIYGQKHARELHSARNIAARLNVPLYEHNISSVFALAENPLLGKGELPTGTYLEQIKAAGGVVPTYVPFRNGTFISVASALALSLDADYIYYGAHADDAAGNAYPDCTEEFYDAMREAVHYGSGGKLQLVAPFQYLNKTEINALGLELGVPFHLTWSCYAGGEVACGECGTCIDRASAFASNGVRDPIPYVPGSSGDSVPVADLEGGM